MTPNRRLIAQYFDVYRPIIDTYLFLARIVRPFDAFVHTYASMCVRNRSQQPNVTPNLRQRMCRTVSMRIRRWKLTEDPIFDDFIRTSTSTNPIRNFFSLFRTIDTSLKQEFDRLEIFLRLSCISKYKNDILTFYRIFHILIYISQETLIMLLNRRC